MSSIERKKSNPLARPLKSLVTAFELDKSHNSIRTRANLDRAIKSAKASLEVHGG